MITRCADLAAEWRATADGWPLIEATRETISLIMPADAAEAGELIEGLIERVGSPEVGPAARSALFDLLDRVRRREFTSKMRREDVGVWTDLAVLAIERSNYTFAEMLASRTRTDPRVVALRVLGPEAREVTVADLARACATVARGLIAMIGDDRSKRVAILSENNLDSAVCDLACLAGGIVNVRVPANAVPAQVEYILRHSGCCLLLVHGEEQLGKVLPALGSLPDLQTIISLSPVAVEAPGLIPLPQLLARGTEVDDAVRLRRAASLRSRDLATIMYTSGTTGMPKGIMFSHLNIISKRFCRGFALREIGQGDVFLAYLPLYHTFGRWLELVGSLYWGATYVFARDPSQATLLEDFAAVRPTTFISVPKKWTEIYEQAKRESGEESGERMLERLRLLTGGRLRLGLSAAGYLDPLIFREMQAAGIELCSGYGMTEATGGITMTPPGAYRDNSIGVPLPGVELRVGDDGELLMRGSYIMMGYFQPEDGNSGIDADGWFASGDVVARDEDGHYRILDRKKEIYKNRKGQTIAPQRVENLFRDFEAVSQAFLVGDHREYNTLLIWPDYDALPGVSQEPPEEIRGLIGSLVASANRFLAPYERVVDFELLTRPLSQEHGELTPKGTFKRQVVEENWKDLIEPMYQERLLTFGVEGRELRIPNWVLRELGVTRQDMLFDGHRLHVHGRSLVLAAGDVAPDSLRIGDFQYFSSGPSTDLGDVLSSPALWLGNDGLRAFVGEEAFLSLVSRRRQIAREMRVETECAPPCPEERAGQLAAHVRGADITPLSLHAAATLIRAGRADALSAVAHLQRGLAQPRTENAALCSTVLRRVLAAADDEVRRAALRAVLPFEPVPHLLTTLRRFFGVEPAVILRDEDHALVCERGLPDTQVDTILSYLADVGRFGDVPPVDVAERRLVVGLLRLISAYAVAHPVWYAKARYPLARLSLHADAEVSARAGEELDRMQLGFRAWIGPNLRMAVDPENGREYGWRDVISFDEAIGQPARTHLLRAITETGLVRESVFLFRRGVLLSLADILPGGIWVSHLGTRHGKSVYRLSIQTRSQGSFDLALNLSETIPVAELREEIRWLMSAGAEPKLVEDFGGYYPEFGIFTEEFIPGETVERQIARLARLGSVDRLRQVWPFLVWTSFSVNVDFWERTGRTMALAEPSPDSIIVPSHDYQVGARLISISHRSSCASVYELLRTFIDAFVDPVERAHPELRGQIVPAILLSPLVEVLGAERARQLLETERGGGFDPIVDSFLEELDRFGFSPKQVYFAVQRYARWLALNPEAFPEARAAMLRELWDTYGLDAVEKKHPDARARFFRQTVFRGAREEITAALEQIMRASRAESAGAPGPGLGEEIAAVRGSVRPSAEEDYFLARMFFPHLAPTDDVTLISLSSGDRNVADVVVTITDAEGGRVRLRGPASPREVSRLLGLFLSANLPVTFGAEHEFLLALDDREQVIGGLFYRLTAEDRAHMEKIVVDRKHRKRGVSDALMHELMRRLHSRGVRSLETGFFRPEYFFRFGFRIEPHYGGLYRELTGGDTR